jgi:hypothetical protein
MFMLLASQQVDAILRREAGFNSVNILLGYPSVRIVSPLELIYGNEEEI